MAELIIICTWLQCAEWAEWISIPAGKKPLRSQNNNYGYLFAGTYCVKYHTEKAVLVDNVFLQKKRKNLLETFNRKEGPQHLFLSFPHFLYMQGKKRRSRNKMETLVRVDIKLSLQEYPNHRPNLKTISHQSHSLAKVSSYAKTVWKHMGGK